MRSIDSLIYWTCAFLSGLYAMIYGVNLFIAGFFLLLIMLFVTILKFPRLKHYLLFGSLFYMVGGAVLGAWSFGKHQLPVGEYTYVGCVKELIEREEWSSVKVSLTGYWNADLGRWEDNVVGEKVVLICTTPHIQEIKKDLKIIFSSSFSVIDNKGNPGEFKSKNYYLSQGVSYSGFLSSDTIIVAKGSVRKGVGFYLDKVADWSESIFNKYLDGKEAAIVKGMLLGDQSSIDYEVKQAFINTGSSHMLAVSGAHIAVITAVLIGLINRLGMNAKGWGASIFLLTFLWAYAFLTGASASVLRSVIMFSLFIIVRFAYRPANNVQILSLSALLILVFNWNSALDVGFQLSYAAMLGIFLVYPKLLQLVSVERTWLKWMWEGTVLCVAAQVFTTPLALYHFHQFPNYFILSNFLVMLASTPMMIGGMLLLAISWVPLISTAVGGVLNWITYIFIESLVAVDKLPSSVAYGYDYNLVVLILILFVCAWLVKGKNVRYKYAVVGLMVLMVSFQRWGNYFKDGVLFFNEQGIVFVVKEGDKAILFSSDYGSAVKKATRLMEGFVKIYPCTYQIQVLPKGKEEVEVVDWINIKARKGFYEMDYQNRKYFLIYDPFKFSEQNVDITNANLITFESVVTLPNSESVTNGAIWIKKKG